MADLDAASLCRQATQLQGEGRLPEARRLFERALIAEPGHFQAGISLAVMDLDTGNLVAADSRIGALLAAHGPSPALAWLGARIALARGDHAAAASRIAPALAATSLTPDQRGEALLLKAAAFDGLERTDEAFAAAAEGKALQRQVHAARAASREGEVAKLNRLADWFAAGDPAPWRNSPDELSAPGPARIHVFLVGFPRSGTTLLEQVLAGHPEVSTLEEAPTLAEAYAEFMTGPDDLARLARLTSAEAEPWRRGYWRTVTQLHAGPLGRVFVDKAPAGTLYLPLIAKLFPRAKILFALRDPRDVTLSCFRNNFQLNAMTYAFTDLAQTAACYDACMRMADIYRTVLPLAVRDARHEAFVQDTAAERAAIGEFLGIQITDGMVDVAATSAGRAIRTPSARQVRAGLNASGLGRWRAYAAHLAPVMPTLAPWVERFGYSVD